MDKQPNTTYRIQSSLFVSHMVTDSQDFFAAEAAPTKKISDFSFDIAAT